MLKEDHYFFILDMTHPDARGYISMVESVAFWTFSPRKSLDKTKALVQIKGGARGYDHKRISWMRTYSSCVLGAGSIIWARIQMARGWTEEDGNEWTPSKAIMDANMGIEVTLTRRSGN